MVVFNRRDEFEDSDSNPDTVAAEAHRLYESDEFREDVIDAVAPVFRQHLDCEAVDAEAEEVLREWFYKDGEGGLFQLRNQVVTNRDANLQPGDVIRMVSARDEETVITHVVRAGDPPETGVKTLRVDPETGVRSPGDFGAGHVKYSDRFEIDRSERGRNPHTVAREIADALEVAADA